MGDAAPQLEAARDGLSIRSDMEICADGRIGEGRRGHPSGWGCRDGDLCGHLDSALVDDASTGLGAGAAQALDPNLSPGEAFRSGYEAYKAGDAATALEALNFAADKGHPGALWKLGRMYQTGDLVAEDDVKAMEIFAKVANEYGG